MNLDVHNMCASVSCCHNKFDVHEYRDEHIVRYGRTYVRSMFGPDCSELRAMSLVMTMVMMMLSAVLSRNEQLALMC